MVETSLERGLRKPPVTVDVAAKGVRLCRSPNVSFAQLEHTLLRDAPLTAKVMAIANSAMYGAAEPAKSLKAAAIRIGHRCMRDVLLQALAMSQVFDVPRFTSESTAMRHHALLMAHVARAVALECGADEDDAFASGLLHDVGKPVVLQAISQSQELMNRARAPEIAWLISDLHGPVGQLALERWGLDARIARVAGAHVRGVQSPPSDALVDVIAVAHLVSRLALQAAVEAGRPPEATAHGHASAPAAVPAAASASALAPADAEGSLPGSTPGVAPVEVVPEAVARGPLELSPEVELSLLRDPAVERLGLRPAELAKLMHLMPRLRAAARALADGAYDAPELGVAAVAVSAPAQDGTSAPREAPAAPAHRRPATMTGLTSAARPKTGFFQRLLGRT